VTLRLLVGAAKWCAMSASVRTNERSYTVSKQARNTGREQRLARAAAERRRAKRNRLLAAGGGLVIVGLLVAIVVALVNALGNSGSRNDRDAPTALVAPAGSTAAGAIPVGDAAAPVKLEVYLDYMCPFCGRFERANADELNRVVADGTVRLEVYPLSFLDKASNGTRYSTRAANAVATVADRAPDKVLALNQALFARQPEEGSEGLTNEQIATLAGSAGIPQEVISAFPSRTFEPWIANVTDTAFGSGITGTPTVKINDKVFKGDLYTAGPLTDAITAARSQ
jgi:protein-disulfide isomerase